MTKKSKAGFSLVELMVVVAIIGILATVAVPNFQRFQARAKQASARTELTGIFTAQRAFQIEYQTYHGHLPAIGFVPEGVQSAGDHAPVERSRIYATSAGAANLGGALDGTVAGMPRAPSGSTYVGAYRAHASGCASMATVTHEGVANASDDAAFVATGEIAENFTAIASGCPRTVGQAATETDVWTINQNRELVNVRSGI